jgi:flagellar biosynthesis protein FlhF
VITAISQRIRIYSTLIPKTAPEKPHVVALLGPTGVGKTTTIAKLAAHAAFNSNLKVGLVTLDNFRIAAIEQLKTYGEIMGISVSAVSGVSELAKAIQALSDRDLILVDTAGRNHREIAEDWELASFLNAAKDTTKALVVSATTRSSDLADAVDQYEIFNPNCLIFTKLDETGTRGAVVNELLRSGKPLAYLTVGQGVPHDIVQVEAKQLVELTIGPKGPELWTKLIQATRHHQLSTSKESTKFTRRQAH